MNFYIADFGHRYGTDSIVFKSELTLDELPEGEPLAYQLNIDFEPEKNEILTVRELDLDDITVVTRRPKGATT